MTGFLSKKLIALKTLGEKLQKFRQEKGISIEKAARAINVNAQYLKNIEKDNYDALPADVYTTNILKSYAKLLELNPAIVVDVYNKEKSLYLKIKRGNKVTPISSLMRLSNIFLNPRVLKYAAIAAIIIALGFYLSLEISKIISPPELVIDSPPENLITSKNQISIIGHTEKEVSLSINNRPLFSDQDGNFGLELNLQNGLNIIKIAAHKKHSKEQVVYRKIIVESKGLGTSD